jgi:hypothetical protein
VSKNIQTLALKHLFVITLLITAAFNSSVFAQSQKSNDAINELKKRGQYDSLMDAYKKAKGDEEPPTQDAVGQMKKLLASDGAAGDRFGQSVAISGDTAVIGASNDDANRGAAYVFVRTGTVWSQQQKLTASDGAAGDFFGFSVAINGNTIAVGSPSDDIDVFSDDKGSVYVFTQVSGSWIEQTKLFASDREDEDKFGISVALNSSGTLVIGAYFDDIGGNSNQGSVYVYSGTGPIWFFQTKLTASDGVADDNFGEKVAIDGNWILVGSYRDDIGANVDQGSAYLFDSLSSYAETKLTNPSVAANGLFGFSVAISGDFVVVGAMNDIVLGVSSGSATIFVRSGGSWILDQTVFPTSGQNLERFGHSVGVSGGTVVIGAEQTFLPNVQGSVYLFEKISGVWTRQQQIFASDSASPINFGYSIAISGINIIVGSPIARVGTNSGQGAAYAFRVLTNNWTEEAFKVASDGAAEDYLGWDVAINGDTAVIGSPFFDFGANSNQGAAYVFVRSGTSWVEVDRLTNGDGNAGDTFGYSVDIYGDRIVVGAPFEDAGQGAVYIFEKVGGVWIRQPKLVAPDGSAEDRLGLSVAISQDRIVAGASNDNISGNDFQGSAYVFVKPTSSPWVFESKLTADDGEANDRFGESVDIFSNTIVVGSPIGGFGTNDAGSAYIFTRSGSTWTQQTELNASDGETNDFFGNSVAISGNTVVVGAILDNIGGNNGQGSAYVFTGGGFSWTQQAKITDPNGGFQSRLGNDVAIDGDVVVVGSAYQFSPAADSILLFERVGTNWFLRQTITRGGTTDEFGQSVAISGDKVVAGVPFSDASVSVPRPGSTKNLVPTATDQGGAYFFVNSLVPTAANVTVGGRVLTAENQGVRNAIVMLTDSSGNTRSVRTNTFGYFAFEEVEVGQTYILSARSKEFNFASRVLSVNDEITDLVLMPD